MVGSSPRPRRYLVVAAVLSASTFGCTFDTSGTSSRLLESDSVLSFPPPPTDAAFEISDGPAAPDADAGAPPDTVLADAPTDCFSCTDGSLQPRALSAEAISAAFAASTVPCVLADGSRRDEQIPLVDKPKIELVAGSVTLAGASEEVSRWTGDLPCVVLLWDPNACKGETWTSAGLLIRGATLDATDRLVLAAETSAQDMDMLDVNPNGTFQQEYAGVDDAPDQCEPQLLEAIIEAKRLVLSLAFAP